MLDRLQKYLVAVVAGVLALISFTGVALSLTVWKPANEVIASVAPQHPLVMTRGGVLPLLGSDVTVTVKGEADETVSVVLGTTSDVVGWIGDSAYTEVIGIESGFTQLKTTEHEGSKAQKPQSGADHTQSLPAADSMQSTADSAQSARVLADELATNDMWIQTASGTGEAVMKLSEMTDAFSIIAASDDVAPTLTLTWSVQSTNVALIVFTVFAIFFALVTAVYILRQILLERSRLQRAQQLEARRRADLTQTQSISLEAIQEYAASVEAAQEASSDSGSEENTLPDTAPNNVAAADKNAGESLVERGGEGKEISVNTSKSRAEETELDKGATVEEETEEAIAKEQPVQRTLTLSGVHSLDETHTSVGADTTPEEAGKEAPKGRHSANQTPIEIDPPETVPTDTGTIDLSEIRPGIILPSRRALREARERGEASVQIDGHEFDTGLIPQIRRMDDTNNAQRSVIEAHVDEYIHEDPAVSSSEQSSGWRSMMSLWGKGTQQAQKDN